MNLLLPFYSFTLETLENLPEIVFRFRTKVTENTKQPSFFDWLLWFSSTHPSALRPHVVILLWTRTEMSRFLSITNSYRQSGLALSAADTTPRLITALLFGCYFSVWRRADLQHWLRGTRMESSSWECFPNLPGRKNKGSNGDAATAEGKSQKGSGRPHPLPLSRWMMKVSLPNVSNVS